MTAADHDFRLTTPVLLIGFNRVGPLREVFSAIRAARPARLYFAADGPRSEQERPRCEEVRALAREVDWPCELRTLFRAENAGIRRGVTEAITWFFEHEPEGIILEDDTLPAPTFFRFAQELLERYRDDERMWVIMGNNLLDDWPPPAHGDYWFSMHGYGAPWGWASWRRVWRHYDAEMRLWPELRRSSLLKDFWLNAHEAHDARIIFDRVMDGRIRGWSYQLDFQRIINHGLNILPAVNQVDNIGFDAEGTNTVSGSDPRNKRTARPIGFPLRHPPFIMPDLARERAYYRRYLGTTPLELAKLYGKALLKGRLGRP